MYNCKKKYHWIILLSYLTVIGTAIDLRIPKGSETWLYQLLEAAGGFSVEQLFLFVGLYFFYAYAFQRIVKVKWTLWDKICVIIPAILFAGFMVMGYSLAQTKSLDLILANGVQIIKSMIVFVGYGIGFVISIAWFYIWLTDFELLNKKRQIQRKGLLGCYKDILMRAPFRTTFLSLIIIYIPYVILSYPGIFMGDTDDMILQGFNFPSFTSNYLSLIDENVMLNGHHPIIYTLFIHACLVIGELVFKSYNAGIFLVSISQLLCISAVAAISIHILTKIGVCENILLALIAYFAFAPRIQSYMFLIEKDVFSAAMVLLFLLSLFRIIQSKTSKKRLLVEFILFGIMSGLFRNDVKYIVLSSILVMLFLIKEHRKILLASGIIVAVCLGLFFDVLMPKLHITPGSRREALSVPFQQTARYFRDYPEEITEEEWDAVSKVLDASSIGENYVATTSDNVKNTFHEDATKEELLTYFKAWFQMGLKHPGVYVQATLSNYYYYFYPGSTLAHNYTYDYSQAIMERANEHNDLRRIGVFFQYPEILDRARTEYEKIRETFFKIPVFSLLRSSAVYVWVLILLVFYLLKQKNRKGLALAIPLIFSVGVCFLGPCNGSYFRYLYGVTVCLPIVFFQCLYICKYSEEKGV